MLVSSGFVGSAVVFGIGSFAIDFVFDRVEQYIEGPPQPKLIN